MSESKYESKDELEQNNAEELDRVLEDMNTLKYCKTSILNEIKFMSKMDKEIFEALPLTNSQKEELLLSIYSTNE